VPDGYSRGEGVSKQTLVHRTAQVDDCRDLDGISPARRCFDVAVTRLICRFLLFLAGHWLCIFNVVIGVFAGLPFLAPYLVKQGYQVPAGAIYFFYHVIGGCHQMPERSFFLWGHQMAYCQRDAAIYTSVFAMGLAYVLLRQRLNPLDWRLYLLLIAPLVVDGTLQLIGVYESLWQVRVFTGILFGVANVWFMYPRIEIVTLDSRESLRQLIS